MEVRAFTAFSENPRASLPPIDPELHCEQSALHTLSWDVGMSEADT